MREPNSCFPSTNKAAQPIVSQQYDRRSLDCTSIVPQLNFLNHLIFLTSTSARVREVMTQDGALELLIHILKSVKVSDIRSGWQWSMAFQSVVNIGVRGNETIRFRVVEAGAVEIIINILQNFLSYIDHIKLDRERKMSQVTEDLLPQASNPITSRRRSRSYHHPLLGTSTPPNTLAGIIERPSHISSPQTQSSSMLPDSNSQNQLENSNLSLSNSQNHPIFGSLTSDNSQSHPFQLNNSLNPPNTLLPISNSPRALHADSFNWEEEVFYREEDILLSLQLLAYLSKYPHLRTILHTGYPPINVFQLVEQFTTRHHAPEIQYWSGIIMRNACRKDESRGGLRQCAYMACGRWESYAREFAKCRRCRKAKYCSKVCQSKAWAEGHRFWCIERTTEVTPADNALNPSTEQLHQDLMVNINSADHEGNTNDLDPSPFVNP